MSECENCQRLQLQIDRLQRRLNGVLGGKDAPPISTKQKQQASWLLGQNHCGCGLPKFPMSMCCPACWAKLDGALQLELKKVLRGMWVAAFMKAQELLGHRQTIRGCAEKERVAEIKAPAEVA